MQVLSAYAALTLGFVLILCHIWALILSSLSGNRLSLKLASDVLTLHQQCQSCWRLPFPLNKRLGIDIHLAFRPGQPCQYSEGTPLKITVIIRFNHPILLLCTAHRTSPLITPSHHVYIFTDYLESARKINTGNG